jgi:hypothetical protein
MFNVQSVLTLGLEEGSKALCMDNADKSIIAFNVKEFKSLPIELWGGGFKIGVNGRRRRGEVHGRKGSSSMSMLPPRIIKRRTFNNSGVHMCTRGGVRGRNGILEEGLVTW